MTAEVPSTAPVEAGRLPRRRALKTIAALVAGASGGAASTATAAQYEQGHPSPTARVSPLVLDGPGGAPTRIIWRGSSVGRRVALTFDDGPDRRWTPMVLEILARHSVRATFFMLGSQVAASPSLAASVAEAGHEIGNHNWDHGHMTTRSAADMYDSLQRSHRQIVESTGSAPSLMRPPYGQFDGETAWSISRMEYSIVLWSHRMTADDPWTRGRLNVTTAVPGMIMLSHDGRGTPTLEQMKAIDWLIGAMKRQNYEFVTVSGLG